MGSRGESQSISVLVIDDDRALRFALGKALRRLGHVVSEASNGSEALEHLHASSPPDVALLDLRMDGMGGLEVLRRRRTRTTRMIVMTGHGTVRSAVEAMHLGAFSFLEKPVDAEVLEPLLSQVRAEVRRSETPATGGAPALIGESDAMRAVRGFVARVGPTDETVAVYGETGTGKEVVARNLHAASPRSRGPFVALNAACVSPNLFESELFGHRRGSFTGATEDRSGLFRDAEHGLSSWTRLRNSRLSFRPSFSAPSKNDASARSAAPKRSRSTPGLSRPRIEISGAKCRTVGSEKISTFVCRYFRSCCPRSANDRRTSFCLLVI